MKNFSEDLAVGVAISLIWYYWFKPQRQDWLTGDKGLYINHSLIFTEISFYPETPILLQLI